LSQCPKLHVLSLFGFDCNLSFRPASRGSSWTSGLILPGNFALIGRYLLTVIQGESVLNVQQMSFEEDFQPASISVRLPDKPPQIMHVRPDPK